MLFSHHWLWLIAWTSGPRCNIQLQTSFYKPKVTLVWPSLCIPESWKDLEERISRGSRNQYVLFLHKEIVSFCWKCWTVLRLIPLKTTDKMGAKFFCASDLFIRHINVPNIFFLARSERSWNFHLVNFSGMSLNGLEKEWVRLLSGK